MSNARNKSEQWWRWLLFVPCGLLTFAVGIFVGTLLNRIEMVRVDNATMKVLFDIAQMAAGLFALVISVGVASHVAPREKEGGIIYSALLLVFYSAVLAILVLGTFTPGRPGWASYTTVILYILTLIAAIVIHARE